MKKKLSIFLALLMALTAFSSCGKKEVSPTEEPEIPLQTDFRIEPAGLAYSIPEVWLSRDNVNLIPTSFVELEADIYGKIEYKFSPDESMADLNDPTSVVPLEELMTPIMELLVVRDTAVDTDAVKEELARYTTVADLPSQEGFQFYFLTDYNGDLSHLSNGAKETYDTLVADLPLVLDSIETFQPDEKAAAARMEEDKAYLNFISTTLTGESVTSSMFYDYDLTVVNFWASYCYPDINELDTLQAFYQDLQKKHPNVNFVQVIIDAPGAEAEEIVKKAYKESDVTFTGIMPDPAMAQWIIDNLKGLPTTVFVDNTGKTFSLRVEGLQDASYYMETTESMLNTVSKSPDVQ